jgi:ATP-dependent metalloprotease FtsH
MDRKRLLRNPITWILVAILVYVMFEILLDDTRGYTQVPTSAALAEIQQGNVRDALIEDKEQRLRLTLAQPVDGSTQIITKYPLQAGDAVFTALEQAPNKPTFNTVVHQESFLVTMLIYLVPLGLVLLILFWMMNNAQGGGNRVMSFGKSKAKQLNKDMPKTTFADVAGADEAVEELHEIKDFLQNPMRYQALGAKIPKGVLLYGPPGTGKTLLARAVAGEAGVPFYTISGSDFVEMFVGVGASVTGDTPVLVRDADGTRLMPIGEYVDRLYPDGAADYPIRVDGVETLGYRTRSTGLRGRLDSFGGSAWQPVGAVYRHHVNEIFEIDYLGGRLRTTGDHSVFVREHGGVKAKPARDLRPGDVLVDLPFKARTGFLPGLGTRHEVRAHDFSVTANATTPPIRGGLVPGRSADRHEIAAAVGVSQMTVGVPEFLWTAPREQFLAYLEGLEGDGHEVTSVSAQLIRELAWLAAMHGIGATSNPFTGNGTRQHKKPIVTSVVRRPYDGYVYDFCGCVNEAFFGGEKPVLLHNSRVRDLFEQAKQNSPCIVFVDEIDAVGRQRGAGLGGGHDEREQTLNQLLVEMDGFDARGGVILIAATNRPDILDPALLRPGRFDRQIPVGAPDLAGRRKVLEVHAKGKPFGPDVDLHALAKRTVGMSGADLANVINEAALLTARENGTQITAAALEESVDRVIGGPRRKSRIISEQERKITAYHEGGHALAAWAMPDLEPVYKLTILPRGRTGGHALVVPEDDKGLMTRSEMIARLVFAMGGRSAEELVFHEPTTGASSDIDQATKIARAMVTEYGMSARLGAVRYGRDHGDPFLGRTMGTQSDYSVQVAQDIDEEVRKLIEAAHTEAWEILNTYRDVLDELVFELLEKETLTRKDLQRIFSHVEKRPRITAFNDFGGRTPSAKPPILTPAEQAHARGEPWPPEATPERAPAPVGSYPAGGETAPVPGPNGHPVEQVQHGQNGRPGEQSQHGQNGHPGEPGRDVGEQPGQSAPGWVPDEAQPPSAVPPNYGAPPDWRPATTPGNRSWPPDGTWGRTREERDARGRGGSS